jgi:Na+/proline symporter
VVSGFPSLLVVKSGISLLSLLLFGYATVVPPAIALFFLIYWKRTTEASAFWGMTLGYAASVVSYAMVRMGVSNWDPSYASTLVPLVAIPLIALASPAKEDKAAAAFHEALRTKRVS